ncbi:hypothetical protein BIV57_05245 [Mangrovactinospora gilvigrisea]|uniref:NlpC/P60 domain-containing protein n=1 Tax=Mangrovactinospora gilvigrisea TaxID=1428644 RepID=A0A1J7CAJ6_9ACTN|nr:NlpC/P60 family protein [Mangrovactinospora gilvigrisea]OIV38540.1 hypothetical protein BIV57_05245 [Mangrovactinospora gilvigrisea]
MPDRSPRGKLPLSQLRPGDLLIYCPQATHVAAYLDKGKIVQAPWHGMIVNIVATDANPILSTLRPDPAAGSPAAWHTAHPG